MDERVVDDQLRSDGCQDWQNQTEAQIVDDPKSFVVPVAPEKVFFSKLFDQFVKLWLFLLFDLRPSVFSFSESLLADELDDMDDEKEQNRQQQNHEVDIEVLTDGFAHGQVRVLDRSRAKESKRSQMKKVVVPRCEFQVLQVQKTSWPFSRINNQQLRVKNEL